MPDFSITQVVAEVLFRPRRFDIPEDIGVTFHPAGIDVRFIWHDTYKPPPPPKKFDEYHITQLIGEPLTTSEGVIAVDALSIERVRWAAGGKVTQLIDEIPSTLRKDLLVDALYLAYTPSPNSKVTQLIDETASTLKKDLLVDTIYLEFPLVDVREELIIVEPEPTPPLPEPFTKKPAQPYGNVWAYVLVTPSNIYYMSAIRWTNLDPQRDAEIIETIKESYKVFEPLEGIHLSFYPLPWLRYREAWYSTAWGSNSLHYMVRREKSIYEEATGQRHPWDNITPETPYDIAVFRDTTESAYDATDWAIHTYWGYFYPWSATMNFLPWIKTWGYQAFLDAKASPEQCYLIAATGLYPQEEGRGQVIQMRTLGYEGRIYMHYRSDGYKELYLTTFVGLKESTEEYGCSDPPAGLLLLCDTQLVDVVPPEQICEVEYFFPTERDWDSHITWTVRTKWYDSEGNFIGNKYYDIVVRFAEANGLETAVHGTPGWYMIASFP